MREINYVVSIDSITPSTVQEAGFQCEYNATKAIFTLSDELVELLNGQEGNHSWSVEAVNAEGVLSVYPLAFENNKAELLLAPEITIPGTTAQLQLLVTILDEDYNMMKKQYFPTVKVRFGPSVTATLDSKEYDRYARNLVGAMSVAVSAAEVAVQSATDTKSVAQATEGIVELCASTKEAAALAVQAKNTASEAAIVSKEYSTSAGNAEASAREAEINAKASADNAAASENLALAYANSSSECAGDAFTYQAQARENYNKSIAAADRAEAAAAGDVWSLYKTVTLASAVPAYSEQVELLGDTTKGVRVKVTLPANTTLPNNRLSAYISLNSSRQLNVRGEGWTASDSLTACYFDIKPLADIWNVDVAPYAKAIISVVGDVTYAEGDKVRYIKIQTNDTNPIPAGTVIDIWGLQ